MSVVAENESLVGQHPSSPQFRWNDQPFRLWSLLDMLRFHAMAFVAAIGALERSAGQIATIEMIGAPTFEKRARESLDNALRDLAEELKDLPVSLSLTGQVSRTRARVVSDNSDVLITLIREIHNNVLTELSGHYFLMIRTGHLRELYEQQTGSPFGDSVAAEFTDATKDIGSAARCIALDEWTAAVFHLMRVLEHGLRPVAQRFNVSFAIDSWHKVIKGIEDGITDLRNKQGLTDADRQEITFYSEAASQFRYFKDAWRNHVSHARSFYDKREALSVWNHVREFMQVLAKGV